MKRKIIHALVFDRQFALFKHLRDKIIALENQLIENPDLGIPLEKEIQSIHLDSFTLFYSINHDTITMLDIEKKDNIIPQESQRLKFSQS